MVVPIVEVESNVVMIGSITAAQFNTPEQTAAFALAVEDSLTLDVKVINVVATNLVRRRLSRRQLLQGFSQPGIDIGYTLQMAIQDGVNASSVFTDLVADLTEAVFNSCSLSKLMLLLFWFGSMTVGRCKRHMSRDGNKTRALPSKDRVGRGLAGR